MLITLIAGIYITFLSYCYGLFFQQTANKFCKEQNPLLSFFITCFAGLALIGFLFTAVSIFLPLGTVVAQLLLLLPALTVWFTRIRSIKFKLQSQKNPPVLVFMALVAILLILIMHAWPISHPDTLAYHAQLIKWIETYKAVPGIANIRMQYGLQSSWFVLSALFSFRFTGTHTLTFINSTVLIWYVLFILQQINACLQKNELKKILLWTLLLGFSFWSYTQIRLTATSASPDFIVALYSLLVFYLVLRNTDNFLSRQAVFILLFLISFSITIKISSIPLALFGVYLLNNCIKQHRLAGFIGSAVICFLLLVPFLVRNYISSGYILFPSVFPDVFQADWKTSKTSALFMQDYITAYARTTGPYEQTFVSRTIDTDWSSWLPSWWRLRSAADKLLLIALAVLLLPGIMAGKKMLVKYPQLGISLLISLTGILFWLVKAPDPRFGFGFLLPFAGILLTLLLPGRKRSPDLTRYVGQALVAFVGLLLAGYIGYRVKNFFTPDVVLTPAGISTPTTTSISCNGITTYIPLPGNECGNAPLPCNPDSCFSYEPRGKQISDGFRKR